MMFGLVKQRNLFSLLCMGGRSRLLLLLLLLLMMMKAFMTVCSHLILLSCV